jgi:quinol monooxygenase YgiN
VVADAVARHRASDHFQNYLALIGDVADRVAYTLDPSAVI